MIPAANNPLNDPRSRVATIGPLWNGCIRVRNENNNIQARGRINSQQTTRLGEKDTNSPTNLVQPEPGPDVGSTDQAIVKSKYFARLNNDLRELWQIETPANIYAPSTSIPSFSVNLSGSLFAKRNTFKGPQIIEPEIASIPCNSHESSLLPYTVLSTSPPASLIQEERSSPLDNYFPTFSHASPTFVVSSLTNNGTDKQLPARDGNAPQQLSIVRNESCNILPDLTFYEHICSAVDSVCEASINKLYHEDRTTLESILQQFRSEEVPDSRLNESDWPFSPMTNHGTVVGGSPSSAPSFGTTLVHNEGRDDVVHDSDGEIPDRLF